MADVADDVVCRFFERLRSIRHPLERLDIGHLADLTDDERAAYRRLAVLEAQRLEAQHPDVR